MAGRKPLALTTTDYYDVLKHINKLMFKRKCEQKLLDVFSISNKRDIAELTNDELETLKKCRYERNALFKRQTLLQLILATEPSTRTTIEQKVAILSNQEQVDAYFTMHDTLDLLLRKNRTATAEKNAIKKVNLALNPEAKGDLKKEERKQRDRENYFLGAYVKKMLESSNISSTSPPIRRLAIIFDTAEPSKRTRYSELYNEAKLDPRNPFN